MGLCGRMGDFCTGAGRLARSRSRGTACGGVFKMHSDPGGLILDPFCGGGTTLIAAEQSGRRCFAMDSDPLNCDLTVLRWEQFTGKKARRMKK